MERIEFLRKAVTKAKRNGYFIPINIDAMLFGSKQIVCQNDTITSADYLAGSFCYYKIIYNHAFAEGFFGKDWQTHLQNMVVLREPLDYLGKFLEVPVVEQKTSSPVAS